ncbi:MAG: ABC transporter permease, partial [Muribaculaceae bacterium]|nr:ABC transporter permease [Muribaculaceae bacterium]
MRITVFDIDNWKEIGATLARNKTRTFLTAFGIFWGTAMLAMLMGGAKGLEDIISRNFAGFATNSALMFGGHTTMAYKGFNKGTAWELTTDDVDYIKRNIPEIEAITGVNNRSETATFEKLSTSTTVTGVDEYFPLVFLPIIYEGRFINAADTENVRKICVIGKKVAGDLFGDQSPIGKSI